MNDKLYKILSNKYFLFTVYLFVGALSGLKCYLHGPGAYGNFTLFQHSVYNYFAHLHPYIEDFLYTPSFMFLFIPFAYLPTGLGIVLWAVFNSLIFYWAVKSAFFLSEKQKLFVLYLIIPEVITNLVNLQTNTILSAFILFTFLFVENKSYFKASFFPAVNFFIKGYGAISAAFFVLKKGNPVKYVYLAIAFLIIGLLPHLFYNTSDYITLYMQWIEKIDGDYKVNIGISLMGILHGFGLLAASNVYIVQIIGVLFLLATMAFIYFKNTYEDVKILFLCYLLIWVLIFNHAAESPSYIIGSTGAFIWFVTSSKKPLDIALFILFVVLTLLSPTDMFPRYIRNHFVIPYSLKALPCVLIWIKIQIDIFKTKKLPLYA